MSEVTQKDLMDHLKYDPKTGIFTWIKRMKYANRIKIGDVAGYKNPYGYIRIEVAGSKGQMEAHRLAFLYMTGVIPVQVDHINHIRDDNRWCNLRSANSSINAHNQSLHKHNTSGINGLCFHKKTKKWRTYIYINRKQVYLGSHKDKQTAITIRKAANGWYGFHKNHGER